MNETRTRSPSAMTAGADAALKRASLRARELARQTGTACWVLRDGQLVDVAKPAISPRPAARAAKRRGGER